MKAKKLAQVIRQIVREEVQKQVKLVMKENKVQEKQSLTLTEALQQTEQESYPTMKTFNATDARAGFAAMQTGMNQPPIQQDLNGRPVNTESLPEDVQQALTRDYSELVKRFKK
jgi:hypothetical protein